MPLTEGASLSQSRPQANFSRNARINLKEIPVAKPELGTKRTCQSCGAPFYDLNKKPIVCPKCGAKYDLEAQSKPKRAAALKADEKAAPKKGKAALAAVAEEDEIDVIDEDDDAVFLAEDEDVDGEEVLDVEKGGDED